MIKARIAGHPLHPAVVHFPIGLWFTTVLLDIVGLYQPDAVWYQISYWCLAIGLAFALPAVITGLLEYVSITSKDPAMNIATTHMMLMVTATALFGTSWVIRVMSAASSSAPTTWAISIACLGAITLAAGGWLGGTLVYRYGVGKE